MEYSILVFICLADSHRINSPRFLNEMKYGGTAVVFEWTIFLAMDLMDRLCSQLASDLLVPETSKILEHVAFGTLNDF